MTAIHWFWLASLGGALLFFAAGAATMALRRQPPTQIYPQAAVQAPEPPRPTPSPLPIDTRELDGLKQQLETMRSRADRAEATARDAQAAAREAMIAARDAEANARHAESSARDLEALRASDDSAQAAAHLVERVQRELAAAEEKARHLGKALDRTRSDAATAASDLEQLQARLRESEAELAERTLALRDQSTKNEQLIGRINDAEGLRADYVRLRTTATESEFLKSEVARLEEDVRSMKIAAMNGTARPRRPARGSSTRIATVPGRPIGESLATVIDRFADAGSRSIAIADTLGFPLASHGEDGQALAAYAALLIESANRAKQFLPMGRPTAIEVIDEHGARVSVWTFDVEPDRLMLADLAVSPVDHVRVEHALADLATILAPSSTTLPNFT
ncbi:MAG: hypothetical protein WKG01_22825 [Kofleriaceae bacterium]